VVSASARPHSGFQERKRKQPGREEVSTMEEFLQKIGEEALHVFVEVAKHIIENATNNN
jgi:hypothetical protein